MLIMNFTIVLISDFSDSLQEIVAVVYCQLLLILGFALPLAEHISLSVSIGKYQFFYVFLYLGSLIYLLFVRIDLFRTGAIDVKTETDSTMAIGAMEPKIVQVFQILQTILKINLGTTTQ